MKPVIVTIHGSDLRMAVDRPGLIQKLFLYVCNRAIQLTCVSEIQRREMGDLALRGKEISVFPMGVDNRFLEIGKNRKIGVKDKVLTIVSNRNLLPIYNVSLLIRAIPLVIQEEPGVRFLIAGEGPEKENLEKEAKDLNVASSVQFLGRIPHDQMPEFLGNSDIYVSTSLYDGTSVSLLEAMATGLFPVVTNISSNQEWIEDGKNGFLIPPQNEVFLAKRIIDAIRNKELMASAIEKNLSIIEKKAFWQNQIQELKKVYEKVL